jgi:hypothetical protein
VSNDQVRPIRLSEQFSAVSLTQNSFLIKDGMAIP